MVDYITPPRPSTTTDITTAACHLTTRNLASQHNEIPKEERGEGAYRREVYRGHRIPVIILLKIT